MGQFGSRGGLERIVPVKISQELLLEAATDKHMVLLMNSMQDPLRLITQEHFAYLINAVLLEFYGRAIDTKLLARLVADKLCIIRK